MIKRLGTIVLLWSLLLAFAATASAQFNVLPGFGPSGSDEPKVEFTGEFRATPDGKLGELSVTATLAPGWHIYSTTQESGGPTPTSFLLKTPNVELLGPFVPDHPPERKKSTDFKRKNGDPLIEEVFHDEVTWKAPIRLSDGVDVKDLVIEGSVKGQVCHEQQGCIPLFSLNPVFSAKYGGVVEQVDVPPEESVVAADSNHATSQTRDDILPSIDGILPLMPTEVAPGPYRGADAHAVIDGELVPPKADPGSVVQLRLNVQPDSGWHVYEYQLVPPANGVRPTIVALQSPWQISVPKIEGNLVRSKDAPDDAYYDGEISITFSIRIPEDTKPGVYPLSGLIGLQTCTDSACDPPFAASFSTNLQVGQEEAAGKLLFGKSSYSTVASLVTKAHRAVTGGPVSDPATDVSATGDDSTDGVLFDLERIEVKPVDKSIGIVLLFAFIGGFVLNFMPCVLPVIGLKIMSFVNQAGQSRRKTMLLNVWYAAGMLAVFWVLAGLASVASLGWGQQFNYDAFTIPMLAIVFVMGLSFLGVWEIPIPGFASSGAAAELAEKEGYSGAFFKGVITTILATPCSGPGLATALAYCANKPPSVVYLVFTFVGLGMAMPYIIIGAFPRLIRFIPKPGAWMDTFKQVLGFVLLATVVYMFTLVSPERVVPTIAFIFALWAACWWIGRTPISASFRRKAIAWAEAAAFAAIIGYFAFVPRAENEHELHWTKFSLTTLHELAESQQTVLVDFTADW